MSVRVADKELHCEAYVKPREYLSPQARFLPQPTETDWTVCGHTKTTLYRGFCGSPRCGNRAWQTAMHGIVEHGRLCDSCLKAAAP
jgi:hypothetical protein